MYWKDTSQRNLIPFSFFFKKKKKDDVMVKFSEFRYTHGLSMLLNQFSIFLFPARVQLEDLHTC